MGLTEMQFEQIAALLLRQWKNVSLSNLRVLDAMLHVAEHGCKWRGLAKYNLLTSGSAVGSCTRVTTRSGSCFRQLKECRRTFSRFARLDTPS